MAEENSEEVDTHAGAKPIGGDESGLEAVLIDGILGFSVSLGNAILLLVGAIDCVDSFVASGTITLIAALVAACIFKAIQFKTDAISARSPRVFYVCCHAICFVAAVIFMYLDISLASAIFAAVALTDTLILYGRFLAALARQALMLVVDFAFLYTGLMMMVFANIPQVFSTTILAVLVLISIVVVLLFIRRDYDFGELVSASESKNRSIKVKGNIHTIFLVGFMLGAALLFKPMHFPSSVTLTAFALSFVIAGVSSLIIRRVNERAAKDALRKSMALVSVVLLVPLAIVPPEAKVVLLVLFSAFVIINTLTILDAIIETVRFNLLAAMWLIGKECSVFFLGLAAGAALFTSYVWIAPAVGVDSAILYLCIVAAALAAWLQIKVNYQVYPFEPIIEDKPDDEVAEHIERNGRRKELWHQKVDAVCDQYHLSPREREILPILLRGRDAKYIMDTFYISQSTAKTHIYNIYRKFGIHSRQELLDFVEDVEFLDYGVPEKTSSDSTPEHTEG